MGSLLRSEEMNLLQIVMQKDVAHDTLDALGHLGKLEFLDLNEDASSFERRFVNEVQRSDELLRKLRVIRGHLASEKIPSGLDDDDAARIKDLPALSASELSELETRVTELVDRLNADSEAHDRRVTDLSELRELWCVLKEVDSVLGSLAPAPKDHFDTHAPEGSTPLLDIVTSPTSSSAPAYTGTSEMPANTVPLVDKAAAATGWLGFVSGVIAADKLGAFERVLWRAIRGNFHFTSYNISEAPFEIKNAPTLPPITSRVVFTIFFQGTVAGNRISAIADSFGATLYAVPNTSGERADLFATVQRDCRDIGAMAAEAHTLRCRKLDGIRGLVPQWQTRVAREKGVWHTMNKLSNDAARQCLVAHAWCPARDASSVDAVTRDIAWRAGGMFPTLVSVVPTKIQPPTYFALNKFTRPFQQIIDMYGVPRYREVNPTPFTLVTFPFLFAVMYGDVGHALAMTAFAVYLCMNEKKWEGKKLSEIFGAMFQARYMLLAMGLFSIYTGLLYNDTLSLAFPFFGESGFTTSIDAEGATIYAVNEGRVYPFGLDPAWHEKANSLKFLNSMKMKMSIVFAVIQMTMGVLLGFLNHPYFSEPRRLVSGSAAVERLEGASTPKPQYAPNKYNLRDVFTSVDFLFGVLPETIFYVSLFGYLVVMIFYKWFHGPFNGEAPDLIKMLINMLLKPGSVDVEMFAGQGTFQNILVVIAFSCVPVLFFGRPFALKRLAAKKAAGYTELESDAEDSDDGGHGHGHGGSGKDFDFGEAFMHQAIHSIEYVLGCISNTASYLRLWALSLAHAELSQVLWVQLLAPSIKTGSVFGLVIGCLGWSVGTLAVLLMMEAMSAFLHALRLHWVEFESKFVSADGYLFAPFNHAAAADFLYE